MFRHSDGVLVPLILGWESGSLPVSLPCGKDITFACQISLGMLQLGGQECRQLPASCDSSSWVVQGGTEATSLWDGGKQVPSLAL